MNGPARTWSAAAAGQDTPCRPVTRRHERLKTYAAHTAARCCPLRLLRDHRQAAADRRVRCRRNTGLAQHDADHIYQADVPTICFISGPLYLYDKADTIDKVYKHDLAPVAHAFIDIIDHLAATPSDQIRA